MTCLVTASASNVTCRHLARIGLTKREEPVARSLLVSNPAVFSFRNVYGPQGDSTLVSLARSMLAGTARGGWRLEVPQD